MDDFASPAFSKQVIEFVTVSNEFCKYLESAGDVPLADFVDTAHKLLPLVYLKGAMLPVLEESFEEYNEKSVSEEDYNNILNILLKKFGNHNNYDEIYDALRQENDEPVQLSLAETFADIYQDLKDFLMQYRVGADEVMLNAVWECRQSFENYWGQRMVNAMRVLHHLKYTVVELDESGELKDTEEDFNYDKINTSNWLLSKMQEDYGNEE